MAPASRRIYTCIRGIQTKNVLELQKQRGLRVKRQLNLSRGAGNAHTWRHSRLATIPPPWPTCTQTHAQSKTQQSSTILFRRCDLGTCAQGHQSICIRQMRTCAKILARTVRRLWRHTVATREHKKCVHELLHSELEC